MEKWSREEIEKLLSERKQEYKQHRIKLPDTLEIIEQLLQQLDEAEKRVAGECAEIAMEQLRFNSCSHNYHGIPDAIRQKYGIGG